MQNPVWEVKPNLERQTRITSSSRMYVVNIFMHNNLVFRKFKYQPDSPVCLLLCEHNTAWVYIFPGIYYRTDRDVE